jgi:hypothetical protein
VKFGIRERRNFAVIMWWGVILLEHDVCYLSVLLHLRYKEQLQHVYRWDSSEDAAFWDLALCSLVKVD